MTHVLSGRHTDGSGPWYAASVCEHTLIPTLWVFGERQKAYTFPTVVEAACAEGAWMASPSHRHIVSVQVEAR